MPEELAAQTADGRQDHAGMADAHFAQWTAVLDREELDCRA
ncbi:MAG: hypothetical protein ACLFTP_04125 [Rhodosalinus sp.]